jgi:hypothetical protein
LVSEDFLVCFLLSENFIILYTYIFFLYK